jgi:hypothetical protein
MSRYYVGLDVHKASTCIAVLDPAGKLVVESLVETGASTILGFLKGLRGQVEGWRPKESFRPPASGKFFPDTPLS